MAGSELASVGCVGTRRAFTTSPQRASDGRMSLVARQSLAQAPPDINLASGLAIRYPNRRKDSGGIPKRGRNGAGARDVVDD